MDTDARETPELRRWREEALPPIVKAALDEIRKDPTSSKTIHRLVNDAVKQALSNLIVLLERQPSQDDFHAFSALFVAAVNDVLPEISDYLAVVVHFGKGGGTTIGAVEKRLVKTGKPLKGLVLFLELPNATRDDRNELMIDPE